MTETQDKRPTLHDGRSSAQAWMFAKLFEKAVKSPHRSTPLRQALGYGHSASFDIAYIEEDGRSTGRFVQVIVTPFRDADLADKLNREIDAA